MSNHKTILSRATVLIMVIGITILFILMIKGFLISILMAAIFSGLMYGWYEGLSRRLKGRKSLSAALITLFFILVVLIPMVAFLAVVVDQAIDAGRSFLPLVQQQLAHPDSFVEKLEQIPVIHQFFPEKDELMLKINEAIGRLGGFVATGLSSVTTGTVQFFFQAFILLFTMYYFLIYGKEYLRTALFYLPLEDKAEGILLNRFTSVTRATLKGTLIIGIVQGALGGGAMALAGIKNTIFWGVIMAVLSIIPALGPAIVWLPAAVFLIFTGKVVAGVGLLLFGAIVIGNIDNVLRPSLVGKDAELPDLMILFGTLGGLALFGMAGIIIGPIIAALFVTLWEIYGETFKDSLFKVTMFDRGEKLPEPPEPEDEPTINV